MMVPALPQSEKNVRREPSEAGVRTPDCSLDPTNCYWLSETYLTADPHKDDAKPCKSHNPFRHPLESQETTGQSETTGWVIELCYVKLDENQWYSVPSERRKPQVYHRAGNGFHFKSSTGKCNQECYAHACMLNTWAQWKGHAYRL